jgi:S1-C subfamily serine protease
VLSLALLAGPVCGAAAVDVRQAMVKIFTVQNSPNYASPWEMQGPEVLSGSGCMIAGGWVLTNAHVVSDSTFIQVRRYGQARKFSARVHAIAHEADLALLTVEDPAFRGGAVELPLGELPQTRQSVTVYGFPEGGDTLSVTQGVISRIEHNRYAHSTIELLTAQIDAAINPGNSGGPVLREGRIVGVVMQSLKQSQNIGYMIPAPVIRHVLADLADGRYDGFPDDGILIQTMENAALKRRHGLRQADQGVRVSWVRPGMPAQTEVQPGDVLLAVDGHAIADDGTVELRPGERTSADHFTQMHQRGETLRLDLLRDGQRRRVELRLDKSWGENLLVPRLQYDRQPSYYIYGGLVFAPLCLNFLTSWGERWESEAPSNLLVYLLHDRPETAGEQVVVLIGVLPAEINTGYESSLNQRIVAVDGRAIRSLRELVQRVERPETPGPFVEFRDARGHVLVFDRQETEARQREILATYSIPAARSADLSAGQAP